MVARCEFSLLVSLLQWQGCCSLRVRVICGLGSGNRTWSDNTATNDIGLTVQYGSEGLACQILIERKRPLLSSSKAPEYMPPETVSALLDDVVPPESRGRHLNSLSESM